MIVEQLRVLDLSAIAASEIIVQLGNRNNAASRVVGRISLFLEGLLPDTELARLEKEQRRLRARVADLEQRIGADDSGARLASTLNNISMHMSGYIAALVASSANIRHGLTCTI
jgi:hypothetical protein